MKIKMMLLVVLVVFTALVTSAPHYQARTPSCRVGQSWPDKCNTCTCQPDGKSFACSNKACNSIKRIDLQAREELQALAVQNSEHGTWLPFDITQLVTSLNENNEPLPLESRDHVWQPLENNEPLYIESRVDEKLSQAESRADHDITQYLTSFNENNEPLPLETRYHGLWQPIENNEPLYIESRVDEELSQAESRADHGVWQFPNNNQYVSYEESSYSQDPVYVRYA